MASLANYKTGASANAALSSVKKKLGLNIIGSAEKEAGPATPKAKGKGKALDDASNDEDAKPIIPSKKRGRGVSVQVDNEGNVVADTTPTRKKRARKGKLTKPEELGSEAVNDGSNAVAKATPKKRGGKRKAADAPTPSVVSETTKFYSENDTPSDVNATTIGDNSPRVKQESDAGDALDFAEQLTDYDAYEAQVVADQALKLADSILDSDDRSI